MTTQIRPQRVDPRHCGCTDCLTGYSVPLNMITQQTVQDLIRGKVQNATYGPLAITVTVGNDTSPVLSYSIDGQEVDE